MIVILLCTACKVYETYKAGGSGGMPPKRKEAELEFEVDKELSRNEMEKQIKGLKGNSC